LPPLAVTAFRRGELRLEAELRWHEEFERHLVSGLTGGPAPVHAIGGTPGRRVRIPRHAPAPDGHDAPAPNARDVPAPDGRGAAPGMTAP
jgi:hypothetical protein